MQAIGFPLGHGGQIVSIFTDLHTFHTALPHKTVCIILKRRSLLL